jgi:hypothetical protein
LLVVTHCHDDHIGCLPELVRDGTLTADSALLADPGLGWGLDADDPWDAQLDGPGVPPEAAAVVAALREESYADAPDEDVRRMLEDAGRLRNRYLGFVDALEAQGATVICYQGPSDETRALEARLERVGLRILGPSQEQLLAAAQAIEREGRDCVDALLGERQDAVASDPVGTYRRLAQRGAADAADQAGLGADINNQSLVLRLAVDGQRVLLTGDMQLADPELPSVRSMMEDLCTRIRQDGPYGFAKLAHHTSHNGVDERVLHMLGKGCVLGHSGGRRDGSHPSPSALRLLEREVRHHDFYRTDRNGLFTVDLSKPTPTVIPTRGGPNDFSPNHVDAAPVPGATAVRVRAAEPAAPTSAASAARGTDGGAVEVIVRVPHEPTRVTVTVEVEAPRATPTAERRADEPHPGTEPLPDLRIAPERDLPRLLCATCRSELAENIGPGAADHVIRALRDRGLTVLDELPPGPHPTPAVDAVQRALREAPASRPYQGVLLLGGYDVTPAQRLDVLDPTLSAELGDARWDDADGFIVWSDAAYGCTDGDGLAEIPVSRIPDGRSHSLVFAALQAAAPSPTAGRFGVRNKARPFAEQVFAQVPGAQTLLISEPTSWEAIPGDAPRAPLTYYMLHGDYRDCSRFWGEGVPRWPEAASTATVPKEYSGVMFTGACWGALSASFTALDAPDRQPVAGLSAKESIALSYLAAGALAVVGCTGSHYSPIVRPYRGLGRPMHDAFWSAYLSGNPPARALHEARLKYVEGMPWNPPDAKSLAVEHKILHQFTCLGLGW